MVHIYLEITKVHKFPSLETCSDSQVHVFNCGSVLPATCLIQSRYAPHTSGSYSTSYVINWKQGKNTYLSLQKKYRQNHENDKKETHRMLHKSKVETKFTIESKKGIGRRAHFLLHLEVVVQGHLLHSCHQAFICIHCSPRSSGSNKRNVITMQKKFNPKKVVVPSKYYHVSPNNIISSICHC